MLTGETLIECKKLQESKFMITRKQTYRTAQKQLESLDLILDPRFSKISRIEDRDTRRTFRGYRGNDMIIARKAIAKDKALDTRHRDSSQTFSYRARLELQPSPVLVLMLLIIRHTLNLYLRLQKLILEHVKFKLTSAGIFLRSQNRQNNQTTDKNVNKHISTEAII